jgi:hypothetical protein
MWHMPQNMNPVSIPVQKECESIVIILSDESVETRQPEPGDAPGESPLEPITHDPSPVSVSTVHSHDTSGIESGDRGSCEPQPDISFAAICSASDLPVHSANSLNTKHFENGISLPEFANSGTPTVYVHDTSGIESGDRGFSELQPDFLPTVVCPSPDSPLHSANSLDSEHFDHRVSPSDFANLGTKTVTSSA